MIPRPIWITILAIVSIAFLSVSLYMLLGTNRLPANENDDLTTAPLAEDMPTTTPATTGGETKPDCEKKHSAFVYGYEFCYPENWVFVEYGEYKHVVNFHPDKIPAESARALFRVEAYEMSSSELVTNLRIAVGATEEQRISLDGADATLLSGATGDGPAQARIISRDRYCILIYTQAQSDREQALVDAILATWKWIDITSHAPVRSKSGNIVVDLPSYGSLVRTPLTLVGKARVFEAAFSYRLKDANGTVFLTGNAMTSGGEMSQLNPFSVAVKFTAPDTDTGTLEVLSFSAQDGSEQDLTIIPIRFK